jgi:TatD DNase family protein
MSLFDTHCHLQNPALLNDIDAVLSRAFAAGITRMLCCATSENDWQAVIDLAALHDCIVPALGIHPWYMNDRSPDWLDKLEVFAKSSRAAIGEIGIDHALEKRNDEEQHTVFAEQIKLANRLHKPVSVHCRKAWAALLEILTDIGGVKAGCVIHSYSGPADLVARLEKLGCSLSFSGSITRPNNRRAVAAVMVVSAGRLLVETDSPDIVPSGVASRVNEPANLARVVDAIGGMRGMSSREAAALTYRNATAIFGGPAPSA